jgi:hypothetical protein
MVDEREKPIGALTVTSSFDVQLQSFENALLSVLGSNGLPTESIFVSVHERAIVGQNIGHVIAKIASDQRERSIYISKFVAAAASGLFDAALNYLWDETIFELRRRVAQYDLSYFFDNAVKSSEKRKKLGSEDDLSRIDDSELIHGAKEIGLISEIGFQHLDYIRFMRNYASAAHPNQIVLTGLQLTSWLETCIREVISLPLSEAAIEIRKLLSNIKANVVTDEEAKQIGMFFLNLTQDQVNNLASGFFGIYTRQDTTSQTRENIHRLLPPLWSQVDEITRQQFGVKYGKFVANNDQKEASFAKQFLESASALAYIPDTLRAAEMGIALDNLLTAHRGFNNFYNEPPFARELQRLVSHQRSVPSQIEDSYVLGLVEAFLGNGNGIAFFANDIYRSMIDQFDSSQALKAVLSFSSDNTLS